ncbi:MAG: alkaline phosphatase family protein [Acidobacteriota bacterium]|nr:alkaline phosphatase family protein [Acidobacteriota bacterium]
MKGPSKRRIHALLFAAALAAFVHGCAPRAPLGEPPSPRASRAILVSVDGMGGERLSRLLAERGKLPAGGLARLADTGFYAVRSIPSTPSLTPAAHATHVTGASPRDTGIVGNSLLDFSKSFGSRRTGFDTPLRAETLCEAARRQGKRVGVMAYPHAGGTPPSGCAGFGMNWVAGTISPARVAKLAAPAWTPAGDAGAEPRSFSPPRRAVLDFPPTTHKLALTALDSTDDGSSTTVSSSRRKSGRSGWSGSANGSRPRCPAAEGGRGAGAR